MNYFILNLNNNKITSNQKGTPALSRPIELFTQLNALIPSAVPSAINFGKRYCDAKETPFGWDFNGSFIIY